MGLRVPFALLPFGHYPIKYLKQNKTLKPVHFWLRNSNYVQFVTLDVIKIICSGYVRRYKDRMIWIDNTSRRTLAPHKPLSLSIQCRVAVPQVDIL